MTRNVCIIPARMQSSRFPGKPLKPLLGLPLILHIYERCRRYDGFERTVVATCDAEIKTVVENHGGQAVMTADTHERCTDRVEEALVNLRLDLADADLVVMVQGDEVLVSPEMIAGVMAAQERTGAEVVNLGSRLYRAEDHEDPNTVKMVAAPDGRGLFFSRAPIPSRARAADAPAYQQTGIMAFTYRFLKRFSRLSPTPLEIAESVDMLRVIEHGLPLYAVFTEKETLGVDTEADLKRGEEMLAADPLTSRYHDRKNWS